MNYFEKTIRVLILSSTALGLGLVPVAAAVGRAPDQSAIMSNLDGMSDLMTGPYPIIRDGLVMPADDCGDGPEPSPTPDAAGSLISFTPIDCHEEELAKQKLGPAMTKRILIALKDTDEECKFLVMAYRIDCLANRYEQIARKLPNVGENRKVKRAFEKAAGSLRSIVAQTADPTAPQTKFSARTPSGGTRPISSRKLTAVKPELQAQANAAAEMVVEELSTTLLRSSENSARRQIYFSEIAEAVDSNKVLLRS